MFTIEPEQGGTFVVYLGTFRIFGGLTLAQAFKIGDFRVIEATR